jgi:threonine/homoserine/homoserine lactone efflux protein
MIAYLLGALAILGLPGPTNTLLAAATSARHYRECLVLIPTVVLSYIVALFAWILLLSLAQGIHGVFLLVRTGCALYLFVMAWRFWSALPRPAKLVQARDVAITTLLNPKAALIGSMVVSREHNLSPMVFSYIVGFAGVCTLAVVGWITIGALLSGLSNIGTTVAFNRSCAVVLTVFAVAIIAL